MGGIGAPEIIIFIFVLIIAGLPIWGIIDAAIRPNTAWKSVEQSKVLWVLVQIVLWTLGAVIYLVFIRPKLKRVSA